MSIKFTFLGTGTSQGVPMIGGGQETLNRANPKNWRTRCSAHLEIGGLHIQIDAGPEFRMQCLQNNVNWIDYFLLTHGHADHVLGMDDLRRFCDMRADKKVPVFASDEGMQRIKNIFPYALLDQPTHVGYPCFDLKEMPECLELENGLKIHSVKLPHGAIETLGFVFEFEGKRLAYYSDCKSLTKRARELAKDADALVIDGLRPNVHPTHLSIFGAMKYAEDLNVKRAYFTHTTWQIDYDEWSQKLPPNYFIAYDGLQIEI